MSASRNITHKYKLSHYLNSMIEKNLLKVSFSRDINKLVPQLKNFLATNEKDILKTPEFYLLISLYNQGASKDLNKYIGKQLLIFQNISDVHELDSKTISKRNRAIEKIRKINLPKSIEKSSYASTYVVDDIKIRSKLSQLKNSARKRNIEFDLTYDDIKKLLEVKTCYYLGTRFSYNKQFSRTIDRLDNKKGYIKGNVVACSYKANSIKETILENSSTSLTMNQFLKMVDKFQKLPQFQSNV